MWAQLGIYGLILMLACGSSSCQQGVMPVTWQRSLILGQRDPTFALETTLQQARLLQQAGRVDQALQTLLAFNQQAPGNLKILNQLGICYDLLGDHRRAQAIFRQILAVDPENLPARNNLGYSYLLAGDYDRAQDELQQVLQQEPGNERARNNLGLAWLKQGCVAEAQQLWAAVKGENKAKELVHQVAAQLQLPLTAALMAPKAGGESIPPQENQRAVLAKYGDQLEEDEGARETFVARVSCNHPRMARKASGRKFAGVWPAIPLREKLLKVEAARPLTSAARQDYWAL